MDNKLNSLSELVKKNNLKEKSEKRFYKKLNLLEKQKYNEIIDRLADNEDKIDLNNLKMKACNISIVKDFSLKYDKINQYIVVFDTNYYDEDDFKWLTYKSIYSLQGELLDDYIILLDEELFTTNEKLTDNIPHMSISKNIKFYDSLMTKYDIEKRTIQYFWQVIKVWQINDSENFKDTFEDIDLNSIKIEFNFIEFCFGHIIGTENFYNEVIIRSSFAAKHNGNIVFAYDVLFNEFGEIIDDSLYDIERCFY